MQSNEGQTLQEYIHTIRKDDELFVKTVAQISFGLKNVMEMRTKPNALLAFLLLPTPIRCSKHLQIIKWTKKKARLIGKILHFILHSKNYDHTRYQFHAGAPLRMSVLWIVIGFFGRSSLSVGTIPILSTTPIPLYTLPNIVCLPSR